MLNHVRVPELIRTVTASQDLSLGALNYTTSIDLPFQLEQILVHSDTGITEVFNAAFDSENGANYDVKLGAMDFDGLQDIRFSRRRKSSQGFMFTSRPN